MADIGTAVVDAANMADAANLVEVAVVAGALEVAAENTGRRISSSISDVSIQVLIQNTIHQY